jgi:DNA-directed RNA polymerase subunit K/omega
MSLKTVDVDGLVTPTGNLYESVAILSKRSRQIAATMKAELDNKLAYFEGFEPELEDQRFQEEQARISVEYETRPEPTERAIQEMFDDEIYFRDPSAENGEDE